MAISYLAAGSPVAADSLAIPVANLAGFTTFDKFDGVDANQALARFLQGFLEKSLSVFNDELNPVSLLGMTLAKDLDDPAAASQQVIISVWNIITQRLIKLTGMVTPLPVPTTGSNLGVGDFALVDLFPGVEKVANGANVTANSVVFDVSDLQPYGSPAYGVIDLAVGQDNRDLWDAIATYSIEQATLRATGTLSAVTARAVNAPTVPGLSANLTDATNPTSGIDGTDLFGKGFVFQQNVTISIQLAMDVLTNTYDVNFV